MLAADAVLKYCISLVTVKQVNDQAAKLLLLLGWCWKKLHHTVRNVGSSSVLTDAGGRCNPKLLHLEWLC